MNYLTDICSIINNKKQNMEKTISTVLHYYRFDLSDVKQKEKYIEHCNRLRGLGLTMFDSISPNHSSFYSQLIKPLDNTTVQLETKFLFDNQWNTAPTKTSDKGLRVFDWAEAIYPNRSIKEGMWLEPTSEMEEIRKNTCKCGYCGKNYYKPYQEWCTACLGSEYLTVNELHLLQLQPIKGSKKPKMVVDQELHEQYHQIQKIERVKRLEKRKKDFLESKRREMESHQFEYEVFKVLVDAGLNFENIIYYSHSNEFCFGWRTPLTKDEQSKISETLNSINFKHKYTFK